jgi:hypothetical protein
VKLGKGAVRAGTGQHRLCEIVRRRAGVKFTEYDGIILRESVAAAETNTRRLQEKGQWRSRWRYERGANHLHARMSAIDREHMRQELEIAADFAAELRQAYPDRAFVISHIPCYAVTFYQAVEDAPTEGVLPVRNKPTDGRVWCQTCEQRQLYAPLPSPDPEFPQVEWGRCAVCGNDVIISGDTELLTLLPVTA